MRKLFTLLAAVIALQGFAQDLPKDEDGKVEFTETVSVAGFTADQLYANAKTWFAAQYKSEKNRKFLTDINKISDKQNIKSEQMSGGVNYTIDIQVKEGRYRIRITNLAHKDYGKGKCSGGRLEADEPLCRDGKMSAKTWQQVKNITKEQVTQLIESIKTAMAKKEEKKSDDW
ncbi:MAG: DUF4468 domain-containing protein [Bacteroidota bacterium]